jgi:hypothetical protein
VSTVNETVETTAINIYDWKSTTGSSYFLTISKQEITHTKAKLSEDTVPSILLQFNYFPTQYLIPICFINMSILEPHNGYYLRKYVCSFADER